MTRGLTESEKRLADQFGGVLGMLKVGLTLAERSENYELCKSLHRVITEMEETGDEELIIVSEDDERLLG